MNAGDPTHAEFRGQGDTFHGRRTRRLANDHLWLEVLADAGPRIVRLGLAGSSVNLLAETPNEGWETPHGRYDLVGGHRLWFAPEDPDRVAVPDGRHLAIEPDGDGICLIGAAEAPTGLVRSMTVRLDDGRPEVEVSHELRNVGDRTVELAPWPITQLPLGGTVLMPQRAATTGHHVHPNRMLVLWPYTSWDDPRFRPRDGLLTIDALPGPGLKLGYFNDHGWVGYVRDGLSLVRRFEPIAGRPHPDLGCNVEVFVGTRYLELELLGPLAMLEPGATVSLVEHWEVDRVESPEDVVAIAARIQGARPTLESTAITLPT